jgi:D-glucuronyl C5-epimerase C-terminus
MPNKDLRYYIRTVWLKTNANVYFFSEKLGLLKSYQERQKSYFHSLYDGHFSDDKIALNDSFSALFVAYDFVKDKKELEPFFTFDDSGIAMCRSDVKPYYNPLLTAHYALVCFNDYHKNKNVVVLFDFWKQANHLREKAEKTSHRFYYDWRGQHFYSGLTQSVIASVFMRAFMLSKEKIWQTLACATLSQMFVPIKKGGNLTHDTEGYIWIEEYPKVEGLSMVLNGFLYSLIGVYEYLALCERDTLLEKYAHQMTEALLRNLHFYKFGRYTRYSRFNKTFENIDYEGRNYFLFKHLFELTQNKAFETLMLTTEKAVNWQAFYRFIGKSNF